MNFQFPAWLTVTKANAAYIATQALGVAGVLGTPSMGAAIDSTFHTHVGTIFAGAASIAVIAASKAADRATPVVPDPALGKAAMKEIPAAPVAAGVVAPVVAAPPTPLAPIQKEALTVASVLPSLSQDLSFAVQLATAIAGVEAGAPTPIAIPVPAESVTFEAGPFGKIQIATTAVTLSATITKVG